jgi:hypothetical protein
MACLSSKSGISSKHFGFPSNVNNLLSYENVSVCEYVNFMIENKPCSEVFTMNDRLMRKEDPKVWNMGSLLLKFGYKYCWSKATKSLISGSN